MAKKQNTGSRSPKDFLKMGLEKARNAGLPVPGMGEQSKSTRKRNTKSRATPRPKSARSTSRKPAASRRTRSTARSVPMARTSRRTSASGRSSNRRAA